MRAREEPALFAEVFVAYREPLLRFFGREVLDPETAWDLMAETCAEAFGAIEQFRGSTDAEGRAWLWTIARHNLYRWRERGTVERRCLAQLGIDTLPLSDAELQHAEELADLGRLGTVIATALASLAVDQREALQLRVIEELEYSQVAARLGVSNDVARHRVSRGLRGLARILASNDELVEWRSPA